MEALRDGREETCKEACTEVSQGWIHDEERAALKELTAAEEARIAALVKKAVS